jgi:hypothetical protein
MDAITMMMALMLTLSEPCTPLPDDVTRLQGETYRVERYRCGETVIKVWARWCAEGRGFWSRPFLLEDDRTGHGVYLDRFAGLNASWHVQLDEVYIPRCGS